MREPLVKRKYSYSSPFVIIEAGSESEGTSLEGISGYFTMRKACCQSALNLMLGSPKWQERNSSKD
jgi:hypothetical protein